MKDEVEGFCGVAVVKFEEVSEGLALLEGNDGKQGIARTRKTEFAICLTLIPST